MDIFSCFLCYILCLRHLTYSYVLLAANIEDFRSLAEKIAPSFLNDEMFQIASEPPWPSHMKERLRTNDYVNASTSKFGFNIDDLVEKVKERIHRELMLELPFKDNLEEEKTFETTELPKETEAIKSRYVIDSDPYEHGEAKTHNIKIRERNVHQEKQRLVGHSKSSKVDITTTTMEKPSRLYESRPFTTDKNTNRIGRFKKERHTTKSTTQVTTKAHNKEYKKIDIPPKHLGELFKGFDLLHLNDSYEDYVTPKKDDTVYDETEMTKYENKDTTYEAVRSPQRIADIKEGLQYTKKDKQYSFDETVNYNKKKKLERIDTERDKPVIKRLPSYAEQLKAPTTPSEYDDETIVTDEVKARTESILDNDKQVAAHFTEEVIVNPNLKKHSKKKQPYTLFPIRDMYKMSSPNYVARLPKVAEPYNFNEPIPEKDREPEHLKPIGHPPSMINGKLKLV